MGMTEEGVPFVALGAGEHDNPPWGHDRSCPKCGEPDLPLQSSTAVDPNREGLVLHYIAHCDGVWLRGSIEPAKREVAASLNTTVETTLWTVLMAIRYGQGRSTYAADDAVALAEAFWTAFPPWIREQILEDWDFVLRSRGNSALGPTSEVAYRWEQLRRRLETEKP